MYVYPTKYANINGYKGLALKQPAIGIASWPLAPRMINTWPVGFLWAFETDWLADAFLFVSKAKETTLERADF